MCILIYFKGNIAIPISFGSGAMGALPHVCMCHNIDIYIYILIEREWFFYLFIHIVWWGWWIGILTSLQVKIAIPIRGGSRAMDTLSHVCMYIHVCIYIYIYIYIIRWDLWMGILSPLKVEMAIHISLGSGAMCALSHVCIYIYIYIYIHTYC